MALTLPIPDDAIHRLLRGSPEDIDAALTILWKHLAPGLAAYALSILPPARSGDCEDVVSAVFAKVVKMTYERDWNGNGSLVSWFFTAVRNNALDQCRKLEVRERPLTDPVVLEQLRPKEGPRPDVEVQKKEVWTKLIADLQAAAANMSEKQHEVARIMLEIFHKTGWPTVSRIHQDLVSSEPSLKESTVKDRRKEVMSKFNPILERHGRSAINE